MADLLTPWHPFGGRFQRGRTDNNLHAEVRPVLGGYHWGVYNLLASGRRPIWLMGADIVCVRPADPRDRCAVCGGSTPLGMSDAEALAKAKADATKALLEAK